MKPWVMRYHCGKDDDQKVIHFHESEESAQRDACLQIIELGFSEMDVDDDEQRAVAQDFLALAELGEFTLALQGYQKAIDEGGWDESFEVAQETLMTCGDTALLAAVQAAQESWSGEQDAEEGDDEADSSDSS